MFEGKKVVVTGAGSGIGAEVARRFLAAGAKVVGIDIDPEHAMPSGTEAVRADVSDVEQVATIGDELGWTDILVNNAGIGSTTDLLSCTPEEWDRVFAVNVKGVYLMTRAVLPGMLDAGSGSIVNIASVAGMVGLPDRTSYSASKGAVIAFTRQVAIQYALQGIRCNCVCPGTIDSPWISRLLDNSPDAEASMRSLVSRQPVGRLGTTAEVAAAVLFLASSEASFITGAALTVDGGISAS